MTRKASVSICIFLLGYLMSYGQSTDDFIGLFKKEMKEYYIQSKPEPNFLGITDITEITITRTSKSFISFYEIPLKSVDSAFLGRHSKWLFVQSCVFSTKDGKPFYSFTHKSKVYLIKACSSCSDAFDDDCYRFKIKFFDFMNRNGMRYFSDFIQ